MAPVKKRPSRQIAKSVHERIDALRLAGFREDLAIKYGRELGWTGGTRLHLPGGVVVTLTDTDEYRAEQAAKALAAGGAT